MVAIENYTRLHMNLYSDVSLACEVLTFHHLVLLWSTYCAYFNEHSTRFHGMHGGYRSFPGESLPMGPGISYCSNSLDTMCSLQCPDPDLHLGDCIVP